MKRFLTAILVFVLAFNAFGITSYAYSESDITTIDVRNSSAKENITNLAAAVVLTGTYYSKSYLQVKDVGNKNSIFFVYYPSYSVLAIAPFISTKKGKYSWTITYDVNGDGTPSNKILGDIYNNNAEIIGNVEAYISPSTFKKGTKLNFVRTSGTVTKKDLKQFKKNMALAFDELDKFLKECDIENGLKDLGFPNY